MGAAINARDNTKETPLHKAAAGGENCEECLQVLLAKGADVNPTNEKGQTPLDLAIARNHTRLVDALKKHGAKTGS